MRHSSRHPNEIPFTNRPLLTSRNAGPTNLPRSTRRSSHHRPASNKNAPTVNHIPNVSLIRMHFSLPRRGTPQQNRCMLSGVLNQINLRFAKLVEGTLVE